MDRSQPFTGFVACTELRNLFNYWCLCLLPPTLTDNMSLVPVVVTFGFRRLIPYSLLYNLYFAEAMLPIIRQQLKASIVMHVPTSLRRVVMVFIVHILEVPELYLIWVVIAKIYHCMFICCWQIVVRCKDLSLCITRIDPSTVGVVMHQVDERSLIGLLMFGRLQFYTVPSLTHFADLSGE